MFKILIVNLILLSTALAAAGNIQYMTIGQIGSDINEEVILNSTLDTDFSDSIYNQKLCCKTELYILELESSDVETGKYILLNYSGTQPSKDDIQISAHQPSPLPYIQRISSDSIVLNQGCERYPTDYNYWNKIDIVIFETRFSFRLHCDYGQRHRNFEWGYVIIMFINSTIMVGVALHSRIWSIKLKNNRALGIPVRWVWLTILTAAVIATGGLFIFLDSNGKKGRLFGYLIEITGDIIALIFGIIILDEVFFLVSKFKKKVWKFVRICDILSFLVSMIFVALFGIVPSISSNFIFNDILSVIITVGAIKLFKFLNLKDAIICCSIIFAAENITALFLHFFYHTMSYNDLLGSKVNSPLIMQMSILSNSLYQKCSWLPVTQIILPGITIAYLRRYDYSRDSKLYFILGNLLFVISTFLWIVIQGLSVHSIPFSLITYPLLFIPIMALAYKRDELLTLLKGKFYDPEFMDSSQQKPITNNQHQTSQIQQSTLQGLIPQSDDLEHSERASF